MSERIGVSPATIERCVVAYQKARDALAQDDQLASDEAVVAAALEADPKALPADELLRRMIAGIVECEAREASARDVAQSVHARAMRYAQRAKTLRETLLDIMIALERASFAGSPFATASIRDGVVVARVTDEAKIPGEYWRTTRALDRDKLSDDIRNGVVIDGAEPSNPMPVLTLRRQRKHREVG